MSRITGVYLRVSTKGQGVEAQLPDLLEWCRRHKLPVPDRPGSDPVWHAPGVVWYCDQFTGKTMDRPAMRVMEDDIARRRLGEVVIWRLDRLGRTAAGVTAFADRLQQASCNLVSLRDGFDLSTPTGRMVLGILASVAQFEIEVKGERVANGIEANKMKSRRAHALSDEGQPVGVIAGLLKTTVAEVERILSKPPGVLWYGGRSRGSGVHPHCTVSRVDALLRRGFHIDEVARATGASRRTVYRRLAQIRGTISRKTVMPATGPTACAK